MIGRRPVMQLPLPAGAAMFPQPAGRKVGTWQEMTMDAELTFRGIRWFRAQGGFGDGTGWRREDWVADVQGVGLHVGRYFQEPDVWKGVNQTMEEAMIACVLQGVGIAERRRDEALRQLVELTNSLLRLQLSAEGY